MSDDCSCPYPVFFMFLFEYHLSSDNFLIQFKVHDYSDSDALNYKAESNPSKFKSCPVEGCTFKSKRIDKHLRRYHKLSGQEHVMKTNLSSREKLRVCQLLINKLSKSLE